MPSPARAAALAALIAIAPACAAPAASDAPKVGPVKKPAKPGRHRVRVAKPAEAPRPSEQEPVLDEIPDPEVKRAFEQRLADPAAPLVTPPALPRVTEIALSDTARGEAAGLKPAGPVVAATLAEGRHAMMPVTIAPGACTTFIAQGGLGVIEVDLFLVLADRREGARLLAQDPGVGPIAIIGGHGHCYKNTLGAPLAAEVYASVRRGAGVVLLREYQAGGKK